MIGPGLPHDRPPLSKRALTTGRVPLLADAAQLVERGIEHVDGVVTTLDLDGRLLVVSPSSGAAPRVIEAPTLVWATGLRYPKPPIPGVERAEENTTGAGLVSLVRRLAVPRRRVVVVGAGLIGTETAATLARAHEVTLVDMLDRPLARFLPRISDTARATLDELGVRFLGIVRDRVRGDRRRARRRAHLDARRSPLRHRRVRSWFPLEPPARARRPRARERSH